ncbi:MAG: DUF2206 domain-containing protein [Candidatus Methanoperedens sp.]|nr:DUF2206 domain-containing protein [Candidatus Methanoperedens sp.]
MIKIPDFFQLNDWEPRKFLRTMVAIHLGVLGVISLDLMGLGIPILRPVIGFFYLTFVPGIIIIRLLKLHKLGVAVTVLLSAGLSLSFLMFSGFFLNLALNFINIKSPLSFWNVFIFIIVMVAILCILSQRIDKLHQYELPYFEISRSSIFLILLPALSIVGTYAVNFHSNNMFIMIMMVLIAIIPILVALDKIPTDLYPLTVVLIALSLLFHNSLISMYITGSDMHLEYYTSNVVINNAYWNSNLFSNLNAMLSIVILPLVYSFFLNLDVTWVFKVIYPIIFSLVPLGLFCVYKHQIKNDKIAFYSVFFFMSFFSFFIEMPSLARQEIAELYFILLIFLSIQDNLNKNIRNILLFIFSASLITSHYGLAYIYAICIIFIFIFSIGRIKSSKMKGLQLPEFNLKKVTINYFFAFYIVFLLLWYINVSSSSSFKSIIQIGDQIYTSVFSDLFNPSTMDSNLLIAIGATDPVFPSLERDVFRVIQFMTQLFIIIGFIKIIIDREFSRLKAEYFYLITVSFIILLLSLLPHISKSLNMTRTYHIALFALSPLFIIGGIFFIEKFIKLINIKNKSKQNYLFLILILGVIVPYFLFNTGFVYELTNDTPTSIYLGMERLKNNNNTILKYNFYGVYTPEQNVYSAKWYYKYKVANKIIYADVHSNSHVLRSYGMIPKNNVYGFFLKHEFDLPKNYYIYLNTLNVCEDTFPFSPRWKVNASGISMLSDKLFTVYSNGCGEIRKQ